MFLLQEFLNDLRPSVSIVLEQRFNLLLAATLKNSVKRIWWRSAATTENKYLKPL
jgi:hypothetical protein